MKRQHHVLSSLEEGLRVLSQLSTVDGVIPGTIRPKSGGKVGFTFQYWTPSGFKLIGRSSGAAQEIFVISANPEQACADLVQAGIIPTPPDHPPETPRDQSSQQSPGKTPGNPG